MTKIIIISNSNINSLYQNTLDYLHRKYHQYDSSLHPSDVTDQQKNTFAPQPIEPSDYPAEGDGKGVW